MRHAPQAKDFWAKTQFSARRDKSSERFRLQTAPQNFSRMIQIVHNSTQAILQLVCSVSDSGIPTADASVGQQCQGAWFHLGRARDEIISVGIFSKRQIMKAFRFEHFPRHFLSGSMVSGMKHNIFDCQIVLCSIFASEACSTKLL